LILQWLGAATARSNKQLHHAARTAAVLTGLAFACIAGGHAQTGPVAQGSVTPSATLTPIAMDTEGSYAYLTVQGASGAVIVLNAATNTPVVLTTFALPCSAPNGILAAGNYLYVTCYDTSTLYVLSIDNTVPSAPVLAIAGGVSGLQGPYPGISLAGTHMYVPAHDGAAIYRVDVSHPAAPVIDGSVATEAGTSPNGVYVYEGNVYCACSSEPTQSYFQIFTATGTMKALGELPVAHSPQRLVVRGNYAYMTNFDAQHLDIIDVTRPDAPTLAATLPLGCQALPIILTGSYAYVGCFASTGVAMIDVSSPTSPVIVTDAATTASPVQALGLSGQHLLAAAGIAGGQFQTLTVTGAALSIWTANGTAVAALNPDGTVYKSAMHNGGQGIAVDSTGNVWSASASGSSVSEWNSAGSLLSAGFSIGAGNLPVAIAVDGAGAVWTANSNGSVSALSNSGSLLSPATGYTGGGLNSPAGISIDVSGNVWVTNAGNDSVTEIIGGAEPVPPLVTGAANKTLGVRP